MRFEADAPANIALIKYMGKSDSLENHSTNSSFSYTLEKLRTFVRLTYLGEGQKDQYSPISSEISSSIFSPISLSFQGQARFLNHLDRLKKKFNVSGGYLVESANNFPADCGLASSASSFAALTRCALQAFYKQGFVSSMLSIENQAELSRWGSGSSCRSFFGPWVIWNEKGVRGMEFSQGLLHHQVIVVESGKKMVSSSEAHQRVISSELFKNRSQRADIRLHQLQEALRVNDWQKIYETSWAEFWDMHSLFETSAPPFGYMTASSLEILQRIREIWQNKKVGPIVTMDAGPNVHLLYCQDQLGLAEEIKEEFSKRFKIFEG